MRRFKKSGTALVLATVLASTMAVNMTVRADGGTPSPVQVAAFCARLQTFIDYLEAHPSPLANFLLYYAEKAFERYCTV